MLGDKPVVVVTTGAFALGWYVAFVVQFCCVSSIGVLNVIVLELRRMSSSSRDQHEGNFHRPGVGPVCFPRSVVRPRDWECHLCGFSVFGWKSSCFRCGAEKGIACASSALAAPPSAKSSKGKAYKPASFGPV